MKQYKELLNNILLNGIYKNPARINMPKTLSLFGTRMEFDMVEGFPLLTTKKMHYKGIIVELLWFLNGDTNIKYLVDNGCNIWNQDAYRWYLTQCEGQNINILSIELFIEYIKNAKSIEELHVDSVNNSYSEYPITPKNYTLGDLGKVYGEQWRNQNGVDQVKTCIERLKSDPMGRYAIIDTWNPSDFSEMALPPCHLLYQFNCRKLSLEERENLFLSEENTPNSRVTSEEILHDILDKEDIPSYYLDLQMYQRSCDTFLGVPFNIASASLLLHLIAKVVNMIPSKFIWVGGDTHIYENHLEQVNLQLERDCKTLPNITFPNVKSIDEICNLSVSDFNITNYQHHNAIKAELSTGLQK